MLRLQVVERAILQSQLALMDEQNTALRLRMEQVCMGRMGPHMAQLPTVHGCEGRKGSVWKEQGKANKHKQQKKNRLLHGYANISFYLQAVAQKCARVVKQDSKL